MVMIWLSKLPLLDQEMIPSLPRGVHMNASVGNASNNFIKDSPCLTSRQMKERSSRGRIIEFHGILAKTHLKMLKKYRVFNGKVRASGDEVIKTSPCHAKRFLFFLFKR